MGKPPTIAQTSLNIKEFVPKKSLINVEIVIMPLPSVENLVNITYFVERKKYKQGGETFNHCSSLSIL